MKSRVYILNFIILSLTTILVVRLFMLQVVNRTAFQALAENQHELSQILNPARGQIFIQENREGRAVPAVTNIEKNLVYAVPPEIADKEGTAVELAKILGLGKAEVLQKLIDEDRKWVAVKKELSENETQAVEKLRLKGIYLQPDQFRFYPENIFGSQVLGFYAYHGDSRSGRYGIEEYYDDLLTGTPGSLLLEKDLKGAWITGSDRHYLAAENGSDVYLTIDRAVQYQAESILKSSVENFQADDGSMVVMDPKSGKVLAVASFPTFNPNSFGKVQDQGAYRNRAVSDAYEPGSVFKAITMAAALDSGAVEPDTTFTDTGSVKFADFTIRNALEKVFGQATMTMVLEQSINTGAIFAQQKTGKEKFYDYVKKFGFGVKTGITLPAEVAGDLRNLARGADINYATASFGQGITATPLQLAAAYGAIANQGKLMKPYIVDHVAGQGGENQENKPTEAGQVISAESANQLSAMLVNVVENGHGKRAAVSGYYIAGKTGTAQMAKSDGPGYDPDKAIGTFVGFGPLENPAFTIVVKITNPRAIKFAESTAAPAFGQMAKFLLNYYQIPPSR